MENKVQQCCDNLRKVAVVEVYRDNIQIKNNSFMVGDKNSPQLEVRFKETFGEKSLKGCKLRYAIVDDTGTLIVGEVPISPLNVGVIWLSNQLFEGARRMKVQLTLANCDGSKLINLQQFANLEVVDNLTPLISQPVREVLLNRIYNLPAQTVKELNVELESLKEG